MRRSFAMAQAASIDQSLDHEEKLRDLVIVSTFFFVVAAVAYFVTISWVDPIPRDGTTNIIGRDFLNFWMYGRAATTPDPSRFYDLATYHRELEAMLGPGYPGPNWSYPPSIMLIAVPFAQLAYLPALLCWTGLGVTTFLRVASKFISQRRLLIALVFSPAAVLCLMSGQSSFVTAAMLIVIFAC